MTVTVMVTVTVTVRVDVTFRNKFGVRIMVTVFYFQFLIGPFFLISDWVFVSVGRSGRIFYLDSLQRLGLG